MQRDLAWLLQATPLVKSAAFGDTHWLGPQAYKAITRTLNANLENLATNTELGKSQRLGRYVEVLIEALLQASSNFEILAADRPVRDAKRTLGAFDLLGYDHRQQQHWHAELAFKQYLLTKPQQAGHARHWVGTKVIDSLYKKARYMSKRQLQLGKTPAGKQSLAELGIGEYRAAGLMLGRLYWPLAQFTSGLRLGPAISPKRSAAGWWLPAAEIGLMQQRGCEWRLLPYQYGISEITAADATQLPRVDWQQIQQRLAANRAVLLVALREGAELDRGWLVPDQLFAGL